MKENFKSSLYKWDIQQYLKEVGRYSFLTSEEEKESARLYRHTKDVHYKNLLVTSHLRFVIKVAMQYRNYGLPMSDLIAEGNLGLMRAVEKFDPNKDVRLSTYAIWWIKASIYEHVMASWSLVRLANDAAHKKLFYRLRSVRSKINALDDYNLLNKQQIETISEELGVSKKHVAEMNQRLFSRDSYLNAIMDDENEFMDLLPDTGKSPEEIFSELEQEGLHHDYIQQSLDALSVRENYVIQKRLLSEKKVSLSELAEELQVSKERIRQIEMEALKKMRRNIEKNKKFKDR